PGGVSTPSTTPGLYFLAFGSTSLSWYLRGGSAGFADRRHHETDPRKEALQRWKSERGDTVKRKVPRRLDPRLESRRFRTSSRLPSFTSSPPPEGLRLGPLSRPSPQEGAPPQRYRGFRPKSR